MTVNEHNEIKRNEYRILSRKYAEVGEYFLAEYYETLAKETEERG